MISSEKIIQAVRWIEKYRKTKRVIRFVIIPFATLSFSGGIIFGYKLVIPNTINFLLSCGNDFMNPTLRGSDYFSFIMLLLISIGLVFSLPMIVLFEISI